MSARAIPVISKIGCFYGIGPVTANIFLRELRPYWTKADPAPLLVVEELARTLNIDLTRYGRKGLVFARVEAGLIRRRRNPPGCEGEGDKRA